MPAASNATCRLVRPSSGSPPNAPRSRLSPGRPRTSSRMRNNPDSGSVRRSRLPLWGLAVLLVAGMVAAGPVAAQDAARTEPRFLRIGTGGQGGTYFPIGSLPARAISDTAQGPDRPDARLVLPGLSAVARS